MAAAGGVIRGKGTPDEPKRIGVRRFADDSMQPMTAPLNEEAEVYRLERLRLLGVMSGYEYFCGFDQLELQTEPGYQASLAGLVQHCLEEYVAKNPLAIRPSEGANPKPYLAGFYGNLAQLKAENLLALEMMQKDPKRYRNVPKE